MQNTASSSQPSLKSMALHTAQAFKMGTILWRASYLGDCWLSTQESKDLESSQKNFLLFFLDNYPDATDSCPTMGDQPLCHPLSFAYGYNSIREGLGSQIDLGIQQYLQGISLLESASYRYSVQPAPNLKRAKGGAQPAGLSLGNYDVIN